MRAFLILPLVVLTMACNSPKQDSNANTDLSEEAAASLEEETVEAEEMLAAEAAQELTLDEKITAIRGEFQRIESQSDALAKKRMENEDEGWMEIVGFYEDGALVKLDYSEALGHGSLGTTYYLKDGLPFFVFEQRYSEASIMGPFTQEESRYYVSDRITIRILEKSATSKQMDDLDMSTVPNEDVTEQMDDPEALAAHFLWRVQELEAQLKAVEQSL